MAHLRRERRPATGPISQQSGLTAASLDAAQRFALRDAVAAVPSSDDTPTRQVDTEKLVSAAFEDEQEPSEELGFDRPFFNDREAGHEAGDLEAGDLEDRATPVSIAAPKQVEATRPAARSSVVVDMSRASRPRTATGPQPRTPRSIMREPSISFSSRSDGTGPVRPPLGSARKRDRRRITAQFAANSSQKNSKEHGSPAGRWRTGYYLLLGALLGLGIGLFLGWRHDLFGSDGVSTPKRSRPPLIRARSMAAALARVDRRRSLTPADRAGLRRLLVALQDKRWQQAARRFGALPVRLQQDVAVRSWLGRIQRAQGQPKEAIATFRALLARAPSARWRVELGVELARSLLVSKQPKQALAAVRAAKQELDVDASEALAGRVVRLLRRCSRAVADRR